MDQLHGIPEFGQRIPGWQCRRRPGAYAVIFDAERRVAAMRTTDGWYQPGVGYEPDESPEPTLRRKTFEERRCEIEILKPVGEAVEYVGASRDGNKALLRHGAFFEAAFGGTSRATVEADRTLTWLTPTEAEAAVSNRGHAWAVRRVL